MREQIVNLPEKTDKSNFQPNSFKRCQLCGHQDFTFFQKKDSFNIIKCKGCNIVCLDYMMDIGLAKKIYSEPYYRHIEGACFKGYPDYFAMKEAIKKTFSKRMRRITEIVSNGRLLDIGCGPGYFLEIAKKHFDVMGIDISGFAASYAREHFNINVLDRPLEDCKLKDNEFDVVTMWDTIEHVADPKKTLFEINRILKTNGLLVVQTGDIASIFARLTKKRWHLYSVPEHVYYFSKEVMKNVLANTGFLVQDIKYEWAYYTIPYLLDRLIDTIVPGKWHINHNSFLSSIYLPVNLFDIMTVYAVKS